jgi:hypothetical protein
MNNIEILNKNIDAKLLFIEPKKTIEIIDHIKKEAKSFIPDISTSKGRKEIASLASKIAKSKVALDNMGKELVSSQKEQIKAVDNERKIIRDELDALKLEIRKPLTDWEESKKEEERKLKESLDSIINSKPELQDTISELKSKFLFLSKFDFNIFPENMEEAKTIASANMEALKARKEQIEEQEKQKAELAKIRAEQLAKEEAEKKVKAEQEAKQDEINRSKSFIDEIINIHPHSESRLVDFQIKSLEVQKIDIIPDLAVDYGKAKKAKIEQLQKEHARLIIIEAREAEIANQLAKEKAKKLDEEAKEKAEAEHKKALEEQEKQNQLRIQNENHRNKIESEIKEDLSKYNDSDLLVEAIKSCNIRHLTINY